MTTKPTPDLAGTTLDAIDTALRTARNDLLDAPPAARNSIIDHINNLLESRQALAPAPDNHHDR